MVSDITANNIDMNKPQYGNYTELNAQVMITKELVKTMLERHMKDLDRKWVDVDDLVAKILKSTQDKMSLNDLYYYVTDFCAAKIGYHPDYNKLAARLCIERLHKSTPESIYDVVKMLYNNHDIHGDQCPLISDELYRVVTDNADLIQSVIDMKRDSLFDYFGIRTLERSYLFRVHAHKLSMYYKEDKKGRIVERPQHMIMRVALGIHGEDLKSAFETYD